MRVNRKGPHLDDCIYPEGCSCGCWPAIIEKQGNRIASQRREIADLEKEIKVHREKGLKFWFETKKSQVKWWMKGSERLWRV